MSTVIVGVDGSEQSVEVVRWAASEAALRGAVLKLVCVTHSPASWVGMGEAFGAGVGTTISDEELCAVADDALGAVLAEVELPDDLSVERVTRIGRPGNVLVVEATPDDLLVVGSGTHGEVSGMLLGSVAMHCAHHAPCPVVVVPTARR